MRRYVIDTSALLASMHEEAGKERVDELLLTGDCLMCAVNLSEFIAKCSDGGMTGAEIETIVHSFDLEIIYLDEELAFAAGLLRPACRHLGLSLGDRACLALAKKHNAIAVTADRSWTRLDPELGLQVECIRPNGR